MERRMLTIEESTRLLDAWETYVDQMRANVSTEDLEILDPPSEVSELSDGIIAFELGDRAAGLIADLAVLEHHLVALLARRHATDAYATSVYSPESVMHAVA